MAASFNNIAERVFNILKGYGKKIGLYDEDGNNIIDPAEARRMFIYDDNIMISLIEDGENSELKIYLPEGMDMTDQHVKSLVNSVRKTAIHYDMQFTIKKFGKEIKPKDFAFMKESKGSNEMKIDEASNPLVGSSRKSTQQWNEARLVIKHNKPVSEDIKGSRARNINKIFIETIEGERFKFPNTHLQGARAMARHVGAGGAFHDNAGQHIISISEEYRNLSTVSNYINKVKSTLDESAVGIRDTSRSRMSEIRESLHQFMTKRGYATKIDEIANIDAAPLNEESLAETITALCNTLNISEDDEALTSAITSVAPLIKEETIKEYVEDALDPMIDTVDKAYLHGAEHASPLDSKEATAAAQLLTTMDFKWFPKNEDLNPVIKSPIAKLAWRLGAMAERLDPSVLGQNALSVILSRISEKISSIETGKIMLPRCQKEIVTKFLQVAPLINESMMVSGYGDWNVINEVDFRDDRDKRIQQIVRDTGASYEDATKMYDDVMNKDTMNKDTKDEVEEARPLPTDKQKATTKRIKDRMKKKECKEANELDEWFEGFDPLNVMLEDEALEEADCGCDCECDCEGECDEDCACNESNKAALDESNNHKPDCGCPFCNKEEASDSDEDEDEDDEKDDETVTESSDEDADEKEDEKETTTETEVQKMLNKGLIESDMINPTDTMRDIMNAMTESKEEVDEDEDTIDESIIEEFNEIQEAEVDELDESCNEEMFDCDGKQKAMFSDDEQSKDTSGDNEKGLTPMFPFESSDMDNLLKNAGMQINEVRDQEVVFESDWTPNSDFREGDKVTLPDNKMGTIKYPAETQRNVWWVDYDDEHGGLYWSESDMTIAEGEQRRPFKETSDEDEADDDITVTDKSKRFKKSIKRKDREKGGIADQIEHSKDSIKLQKHY